MGKNRLLSYCLFLTFIILFCACPGKEELLPDIQLSTTDFFYKSTEADTKSFKMEVNTDWSASIVGKNGSSSDWLSISQESGKAGKFDIKIYVSYLNNEEKARSAVIEIRAEDLIKRVTVKQSGIANIDLETEEIVIKGADAGEIKFSVNDAWTITPASVSWGNFSKVSGEAGNYTVTFTPKTTNATSKDILLEGFINSDGASETFTIIHKADKELYKDRDVVQLQAATKGVGVDLIFMGDGFTKKDLVKGEGKYEESIKLAVEHFFSVEPYITYKEYFNVYMVVAESAEEGVKNESGDVNNKFSSVYEGGTLISCNYDLCKEYVSLVSQFRGETTTEFGNLTTILVLNSTKYAGTCAYWSDGFSIAMCPMSTKPSPSDFKGLINHEAGGHAFAMLADEYSGGLLTITQEKIDDGLIKRSWGRHFNIDFTGNLSLVQWKGFVGHPRYSMVGAYEGAFYFDYGVWRPEVGSCMINNIPYYNAPSRWAVVKRIMQINNIPLTFESFADADVIDISGLQIARTKGAIMDMPPLAPPVFIE